MINSFRTSNTIKTIITVVFFFMLQKSGFGQASLPTKIPPEVLKQAKANAEKATTINKLANRDGVRKISGEVTASKSAEIGFRIQGFIDTLAVQTGAVLKAGDTIAKLDSSDTKIQLELAQAQLEQAEAIFNAAKKEMERERQLKAANASSDTTFDKMTATFKQSQASLALAKLQVQQARMALSQTHLKAPYDCIVSAFKKNEGEFVSAGTPVAVIHATGIPEVKLHAPEQLLNSLNIGSNLEISIPAIGFTGEAKVIRKVSIIDKSTRSFEVIAQFKNGNNKIIPGLFAEARLN